MRKAQSIETHLRAHGGPVQMLGLHAFFQILAKTMSPVRNLTCFHACVAVQDGMDTNKLTSCTVCPRPQHAEEEHVDDTYQDTAIKMNLLLDSQRPVEVKASCHLEPQMASRDFALYAFNRQWKHHKRGPSPSIPPGKKTEACALHATLLAGCTDLLDPSFLNSIRLLRRNRTSITGPTCNLVIGLLQSTTTLLSLLLGQHLVAERVSPRDSNPPRKLECAKGGEEEKQHDDPTCGASREDCADTQADGWDSYKSHKNVQHRKETVA